MKKIVSLMLGVIMSVSISALTSCKKVDTTTSWQIVSYQSGSESMTQQVGFNVTRSSKKIREIWMKIDKIEVESVTVTFETLTAPKELFTILASVAVVTVPSVPTAIGSAVGTVTDIAVGAGAPSSVPSSVELRVNVEEAESPLDVAVLVAKAPVVIAKIMHSVMIREKRRLKEFFLMLKTPFLLI